MMDRITGVVPGQAQAGKTRDRRSCEEQSAGFEKCLRKVCEEHELRLTGHAEARIAGRGIKIDTEDLKRISSAVNQAAKKGGEKPAIFYKDLIFIADAKERAIITAMHSSGDKEKVFTGIDSAVFV